VECQFKYCEFQGYFSGFSFIFYMFGRFFCAFNRICNIKYWIFWGFSKYFNVSCRHDDKLMQCKAVNMRLDKDVLFSDFCDGFTAMNDSSVGLIGELELNCALKNTLTVTKLPLF
jgi:hypothetical protein